MGEGHEREGRDGSIAPGHKLGQGAGFRSFHHIDYHCLLYINIMHSSSQGAILYPAGIGHSQEDEGQDHTQ